MAPAGCLYAFGSNSSGQLGLEHREDVSEPTKSIVPETCSSDHAIGVVAGGNHTLILFSSGAVYAAGESRDGRTGVEARPSGFNRVEITVLDGARINNFTSCSATWEASCFVHEKRHVYSCGTGRKGELGQREGVTGAGAPRRIENFPPPGTEILDIASSMGHTVVVLSSGEVYGWGHGRKGQLGDPAGVVWSPRKVDGVHFKAVRVSCGREFTHIVGDALGGEHVVLGSDKWLVRTAAPVNVRGWKDIAASWGSVYILFEDNSVLSWGRHDRGQLAPPGLPPIYKIAAGSEHVLALTSEGKFLAWGWGEHGNCGRGVDEAGDVRGRWNEIPVDGRHCDDTRPASTCLGAGCASSWLWINF